MFVYKVNVMEELKKKGYSSYRLQKEKIIGMSAVNKINQGVVVGINALDTICTILKCQPSHLIMWVPDEGGVKDV